MAAFAHAPLQPLRGAGPRGRSHAVKSCSPGSVPVEDHTGNLLQCQQCFPTWGLTGSWEGTSWQSNALKCVPLMLQCLITGEPGTPIPPASTLCDCQLHPASLLVLSDAKGLLFH